MQNNLAITNIIMTLRIIIIMIPVDPLELIMIPVDPLELTITVHEAKGANKAPLVEAVLEGAAMTTHRSIDDQGAMNKEQP